MTLPVGTYMGRSPKQSKPLITTYNNKVYFNIQEYDCKNVIHSDQIEHCVIYRIYALSTGIMLLKSRDLGRIMDIQLTYIEIFFQYLEKLEL